MEIKLNFDAVATLQAVEKSPQSTSKRMRMALLESCRLVQRGAREVHRFKPRSGSLERAIRFRTNLARCEGTIDIDPAIAPYGIFVHEPTGKYGPNGEYPIAAKNKKLLRFVGRNGRFVSKEKIMHPGSPADRFLYDSGDRNRAEINNIFARHTQEATREAGL